MVVKSVNIFSVALLFAAMAVKGLASWLSEPSPKVVAELGGLSGKPQSSGFVFVAGRYLPPPYTVSRKGDMILVNRIPVEQIAGSAGKDQQPAKAPAIDADGDFEVVAPAALPVPPPMPRSKPRSPDNTTTVDISDLFSDLDEPVAPPRSPQPDTPAPHPLVRAAATPSPPIERSGETPPPRIDKEGLVGALERRRLAYEVALGKGEVFFFSAEKRVNGTYGSARTMMGVLPSALRYAQSPQDLLSRLRQGGVFFLDIGICADLFRNRTTFPLLESRLKDIEDREAIEARRKRDSRAW